MARRTISDFRGTSAEFVNELRGMARKLVAGAIASSRAWQLLGYEGIEGERETFDDVEVFQGVGFGSRPAAGGTPEVIVLNIGGRAGHPVVVATRDESTRVSLEADETAIWNSKSLVLIKADGTVEIRDRAGVALPLATKADLAALVAAIRAWTPVPNDGGAALKVALLALFDTPDADTWPAGTQKLKAE